MCLLWLRPAAFSGLGRAWLPGSRAGWAGVHGPWGCPFLVVVTVRAGQPEAKVCRWVIAVVMFIPLSELGAYLVMTVRPTRGQAYGSLLAALPGMAGAYGGAVMRRVLDNLRLGK